MGVSKIALFCEVPSSYSLRSPVQHFRVCTQIITWLTCIDGRLHASGLEYTLALQWHMVICNADSFLCYNGQLQELLLQNENKENTWC